MTWRKVLRWAVALLILAGALGGGGVWYVWVRGDHYAAEAISRKLSEIAPACRIEMGDVDFDWKNTVTIEDLTIGSKSAKEPRLLVVPKLAITLDREAFLTDQRVQVKHVTLIRPHLTVSRNTDGTWSLKDLLPLNVNPNRPVPAWEIEDATLSFQLEQPNANPITVTLKHSDFILTPTGRRQLAIEGRSHVAEAGPVALTGKLDLAAGTWSLQGAVQRLTTSGSLAGFLWNASESFQERVAVLEQRLAAARASINRGDQTPSIVLGTPQPLPDGVFQTASRSREFATTDTAEPPAIPAGPSHHSAWGEVLKRLGIEAVIDATFKLADSGGGTPLDYEFHLQCRDGMITNPLLPFPLSDLRGRIDWDEQAIVLHSVSAKHGVTSLTCDGSYHYGLVEPKGAFTIQAQSLLLGHGKIAGLPEGIAKCLRALRPRGPIDVTGTIVRGADGRWSPRQLDVAVRGASVLPEAFPYPVSGITGTIRQSGEHRWAVDLAGHAEKQRIKCHGYFTDRTAGAEMKLTLSGDPLPIDQTLRSACNPKTRRFLDAIDLEGMADLRVTIARAKGIGQPITWGFAGTVSNASMSYEGFPYQLTTMRGEVAYNSASKLVVFRNVTGRHGTARITIGGRYIPPPPGTLSLGDGEDFPGLELTLSGTDVPLDSDLRAALPEKLQQAWDDLRPGGIADFDAEVIWIRGYRPDIELTRVEIRKGSLNARAFPYPMESIIATARFIPWRTTESGETAPAQILIDEFIGWHSGMRATADHSKMTLGANNQWKLHLPRLKAENFQFDVALRRAVPQGVREAIATLKPQGKFVVEGELAFSGQGETTELPNVSWDLTASTAPNTTASFTLGTDVSGISGHVNSVGERQGEKLELTGYADLDQALALGQTIQDIRGRFTIQGDSVVVGSLAALPTRANPNPDPVRPEDQLHGDLLGGLATLSARIQLSEVPQFQAYVTLSGGSLEKYVAASIDGGPGQLAGVMNGHVHFWGRGTSAADVHGRGQLDIVPASLYRLPAIMQIFQAFSFARPNGPAFSSAELVFTIHDLAVHFQPSEGGSIVLSGDTLRLVGGGRVGFDRVLDIEFYSSPPGDPAGPLRNVPVLKDVVGGIVKAATTGWVRVVVTGRARDPHVNIVPLPALPDTWQNIMSTLGPRVPARPIGFR